MRPAYDSWAGPVTSYSATPIYDALYSEYRRLFRTLPGDRAGEEELSFTGFTVFSPFGQAPHTAYTAHPEPRWQPARTQLPALPPAPRRGL
jgi:hypothetical protein